jgi:hypothetical protein
MQVTSKCVNISRIYSISYNDFLETLKNFNNDKEMF